MRLFLFVTLMVACLFEGRTQNYYQEYPINASVAYNGTQYRLQCSTYDSVLQATVTYNTPWSADNIFLNNNFGKVSFTTWSSPGIQGGVYGFIIYDYLTHQFNANIKLANLAPGQELNAVSGMNWVSVYISYPIGGGDYIWNYYHYRYNMQLHTWSGCSYTNVTPNNSSAMSGGAVGNTDMVGYVDDEDEAEFFYYDPVANHFGGLTSGCAGWGLSGSDDYIAMDTGCLDNYSFTCYDAGNHYFTGFGRQELLGSQTKGIFTARDQWDAYPFFIFTFDQDQHQWKADSTDSPNITNVQIKDRVIVYMDQSAGQPERLFYMAYNPVAHMWVKDSSDYSVFATNIIIDQGTVKWDDANGPHIRGFDVNTGWGNYNTPLFLYFHLTNFTSEGQPMIHVRNYSIGTDKIFYDFGDGVISLNNRHVLWHSYRDSGIYNVCIYDSSGTQNWCQQVNMNICSVGGISALSTDTICEGDSTVLSVSGHTGTVQWQRKSGVTWIDEPGATGITYTVDPEQSGTYRAFVTNGLCVPAFSNNQFIKVFENTAGAILSDSLVGICSGQGAILRVTGVNSSFQWQVDYGNGWSSIVNAIGFAVMANPFDTAQYRVILTSGYCFSDTTSAVTVTVSQTPSVPIATHDVRCGPGIVDLFATSNGTVNWYQQAQDSIIHTGYSYSPYLTTTTDYEVTSVSGLFTNTGYIDNAIGAVNAVSGKKHGIRIYTASPLTLSALSIYPLQSGMVYLRIYRGGTTELISTLGEYVVAGNGIVQLHWGLRLQGNKTYDLVVDSMSIPLEINTSGMSYPFNTPGHPMTILGYVDSVFHNTPDYYNFYNISVMTGCQSNFSTTVSGMVNAPFNTASVSSSGSLIFCEGDSVIFNAAPTGFYTYQWLRNDLPVSGATANNYVAKSKGKYEAVVFNTSLCADTSTSLYVSVPCINTFDPQEKDADGGAGSTESNFNLSYNSVTNTITMIADVASPGKYHLFIVDAAGKTIFSETMQLTSGLQYRTINLQKYAPGIYYGKLQSEKVLYRKKMLIYDGSFPR